MENTILIFAISLFNIVTLAASGGPDSSWNITKSITDYGYDFEVHEVITQDGYILEMHRILGKMNETRNGTRKEKVALLMHGLLGSSATWLVTGPDRSIAYNLVGEGYDVWLGNNRGNTYSTNHVSKSQNSHEYWDFSWHEMGIYDLPAMIDHVLSNTNKQNLKYVCFSEGCTQAFVMGSIKQEYNRRIKFTIALSPAAYWTHLKGTLALTVPFIDIIVDKLDEYLKYEPAGSSIKQLIHYELGTYNPGTFRQYDYGPRRNLELYKSTTPPDYPLEKVNFPIAIYHGSNDYLGPPEDIAMLVQRLPNVVEDHLIPGKGLNHYDFVFGRNIKEIVYNHALALMEKYN